VWGVGEGQTKVIADELLPPMRRDYYRSAQNRTFFKTVFLSDERSMKRQVHPADCPMQLISIEARQCDNRGGMT
jgi:hypothetical protein